MKKPVLIFAWIVAFVVSATAAPLEVVKSNGQSAIKLSGSIHTGAAQSLEEEINRQAQNGNRISAIILHLEYGIVGEAEKMAVLIKHFDLETHVGKNDHCFDACLIVLTSGSKVIVENGAALGLHGIKEDTASPQDGQKISLSEQMSEYRRYGVSDDILSQALNKPRAMISWLTPEHLKQMGVEQDTAASPVDKRAVERKPQRQRQFSVTPAREARSPDANRSLQALAEIPPVQPTLAWQDYYNRALSASSWQNFGQPELRNRCNIADFTGSNWCVSTLNFETENDEPVYLQTVSRDGLPVLHEICQYADDAAVSRNEGRCFDWDRSTQYLEMRPYGIAAVLMKAGVQRKILPTQQAFAPDVFLRDLFGVFQ